MYPTKRFFSNSADYLKRCEDDENFCLTLLRSLETLAEKVDSPEEANYFETRLATFETALKEIADPSEFTRTFDNIKKTLDKVVNPDNYEKKAGVLVENNNNDLSHVLPRIMARLA